MPPLTGIVSKHQIKWETFYGDVTTNCTKRICLLENVQFVQFLVLVERVQSGVSDVYIKGLLTLADFPVPFTFTGNISLYTLRMTTILK